MTVKILVTAIGQQIVAGVKQIENKESNQLVGYWLSQPRVVQYTKDEEGNIGVNFGPYCLVSDENEFSLRAEHVVAILEPRQDVIDGYTKLVFPEPEDYTQEELDAHNNLPSDNGINTAGTEESVSNDANSADGTDGVRTESAPVATDGSVGQNEVVSATVA